MSCICKLFKHDVLTISQTTAIIRVLDVLGQKGPFTNLSCISVSKQFAFDYKNPYIPNIACKYLCKKIVVISKV